MAVKLFSHNAKAYRAVTSMLTKSGKAAVIHPTGTGKSYIAFKLIEDNPQANILWLSPSEYIFNTQRENVFRSSPELSLDKVRFYTYSKLMYFGKKEFDEIASLKPAYIILDEFHRAGAAQWSVSVQALLKACTGAKLLGLSATNIRYLDNRRDMAEELFNGYIASEITLGEAIALRILPAPRYITALYNYETELAAYQKKVKKMPANLRDTAQECLDILKRTLENAEGLDKIFARHIKKKNARFIVFCASLEHMEAMTKKSREWFAKVDPDMHLYTVYSENSEASADFTAFKADDTNHLKLLFCIDMLNEGVHVEDIDGVIMLRPTISPTIYKQQLGRALTAGSQKQPLVFDIVNNFDGLYSVGSLEQEMIRALNWDMGNTKSIWAETEFTLIDEVREARQLFWELDRVLSSGWEVYFKAAKQYFEEHGDLHVPKRYTTSDGLALGSWIIVQKMVYSKKRAGKLSAAQIERLESIGMVWENRLERNWNNNFAAAKAYYEKYGNLLVPTQYVNEDGFALGSWIMNLRSAYANGGGRAQLNKENVARLNGIGMVWNCGDEKWEMHYLEALRYYNQYGNLLIPSNYITDSGVRLGSWLSRMRGIRQGKAKGASLSEQQIERLDAIGMVWGNRNEGQWMKAYGLAKEYYRKYGNLKVPPAYVTPDGTRLGKWVARQRAARKNTSSSLTPERVKLLNAIGMDWREEDPWRHRYEMAEQYMRKNGNLNIPAGYKTDDGIWLGKWLYRQKRLLYEEKYPLQKKSDCLQGWQREKLKRLGL